MTSHRVEPCIDANEPLGLAGFWAGVLRRQLIDDNLDGPVLLPDDDTGFVIRFSSTQEPKSGPNQMHFDLTSRSLEDQQATVTRALGRSRLNTTDRQPGQETDTTPALTA